MDVVSFLLGVFLINQIVTLLVTVDARKSTQQLTASIDRLCVFLSSKDK